MAATHVSGTGLDDDFVMLDTASGVYYGLNAVGATVWAFIQQPRAVRDIEAHVLARFDVSPERCAADIERLLTDLHVKRLVTLADDAATPAPHDR